MASLQGANTYFQDTYFADEWFNATEDKRLEAFNTAENQLSLVRVIEILRENNADRLDKLIYEQSRFLLSLDTDDIQRAKLQAMSVNSINTEEYSEKYSEGTLILGGLPVAPEVRKEIEALEEMYGFSVDDDSEGMINLSPGDML